MYLSCGNERIRVVVEDDLKDSDDRPCYGLFRPGIGIFVDRSTPPSERIDIIVHELAHAFEHRLGRVDPEDSEGRQNRVATIRTQFHRDLAAQGGEDFVHALFGDTPAFDSFSDARYTPDDDECEWPTSVCCPCCREPYPSHVISNGRPTFNPRLNGFELRRILVCGKCGRETTWKQRCRYDGLPVPDVVSPPVSRLLPVG